MTIYSILNGKTSIKCPNSYLATSLTPLDGIPVGNSGLTQTKLVHFQGGMKTVVWTDLFQALVMITGMVSIIVRGSSLAGGMKR